MSNGTAGERLEVMINRHAKLYEQMRWELGHSDKPGLGYYVFELLLIPSELRLVRAMKIKVHGKSS